MAEQPNTAETPIHPPLSGQLLLVALPPSESQGSYVTTRLVLYRPVPELPDSGLTSNKHCSEPSAAH